MNQPGLHAPSLPDNVFFVGVPEAHKTQHSFGFQIPPSPPPAPPHLLPSPQKQKPPPPSARRPPAPCCTRGAAVLCMCRYVACMPRLVRSKRRGGLLEKLCACCANVYFFDVPSCLNVKRIIGDCRWRSAAALSHEAAQDARRQKV
jgi:hypothetical protein